MREPKKAVVQIIEDHPSVAEAIRSALPELRFEFLPCYQNRSDGLKSARDNPIDLLILDLALPGGSGECMIAPFKKLQPDCPILVFSGTHNLGIPERCIRTGAQGFVRKSSPIRVLLAGVEQVLFRKTKYLDRDLLAYLEVSANDSSKVRLTRREATIIRLVALGLSYKEIASQLKLSCHTVRTHRSNMMKKIGANSVAELVLFAVDEGLVYPKERFLTLEEL